MPRLGRVRGVLVVTKLGALAMIVNPLTRNNFPSFTTSFHSSTLDLLALPFLFQFLFLHDHQVEVLVCLVDLLPQPVVLPHPRIFPVLFFSGVALVHWS